MTTPAHQPSAWKALRVYLRPYRGSLSAASVLLLFSAAMDVLKPWPLKFIIDHVVGRQSQTLSSVASGLSQSEVILAASAIVVIVAVIGGLAEYHAQILIAKVGHTVAASIRGDVFAHLQQLSVAFHRTTGSGEMLTRVLKDVQEVKNVLGALALETTTQVLMLLGMALVLVAMDARLALVGLFVFGPVAWLVRFYASHIKDVTRRQRRKDSKAASIMSEAIAMLPAVQLFGGGQHATQQFGRATRKSLEADVMAARLKGQLERWVEVVVAFGTGAVLWYGARAVLDNRLTPGDLVVFAAYLRSMYRPTRRVAANWLQISRASVSAERLVELLRREPEIRDLPHATPAPPFAGHIEFDHVSFAYTPGLSTLHDVHVSIPAGSLVALVGRSGAGKSTLVSLLPRLVDPSGGSVRIDGRDVRDYTLASLRQQIAIVTQDAMLFGLSIRANVAYGDPHPDESRIIAALRDAHAWPIVERLPAGLDTVLGEGGTSLSGGERQRLSIARAFYRNARILILDEPTSGLDSFAEAHVVASLNALVRGRTTFVITHRLQTIAHADLVLYLENGRLIESGHPDTLLTAGGHYERLLAAQPLSLGTH